ncbi:hypothetical protein [uncultured Ramlibacter sp.]|uniref:hypothetical protein n=1 Tax=uncultured Ramlibacter sp. TaxID=260755 RepID=UPI002625A71C|nr:hypothetical protein [uncultured Ramlibacter sp.]
MASWYLNNEMPEDELFRSWADLTHESPRPPFAQVNDRRLAAELIAEASEGPSPPLDEDFVSLYNFVWREARDALRMSSIQYHYQIELMDSRFGRRVPKHDARILTPLTEMAVLLEEAHSALGMFVNDPAWFVRNGLPLYRQGPDDTYTLADNSDPVVQFLLIGRQLEAKLPPEPLPDWMDDVFIKVHDKQAHDWMFAGPDCYELTGDAHLMRRRALRRHLELPEATSKDEKPAAGTPVSDYLRPDHPRYTPKLAAAVHAWEAVTEPLPGSTTKQSLEKWLTENASRFDLSGKAIGECAAVSNWMTKGGAPKTPG